MGRVGKGGGGSCQDGWEVMTRWGGEADANGLLTWVERRVSTCILSPPLLRKSLARLPHSRLFHRYWINTSPPPIPRYTNALTAPRVILTGSTIPLHMSSISSSGLATAVVWPPSGLGAASAESDCRLACEPWGVGESEMGVERGGARCSRSEM